MSTLYGQVEGCAESRATRRGTYASRIASSVQSYDGSITMEMFYPARDDGNGYEEDPWIQVYHFDNSGFYGSTIFRGSLGHFVDMCREEMEY